MADSNAKQKVVLVVEDNPDDVLLFGLAAKEACPDLSFVFVRDGPEALAYLGEASPLAQRPIRALPVLALIDARLPTMDGLKVVQCIRERPEFERLRVLLWSDNFEPGLKARAEQVGADCFLRKPLAFSELVQEVKRICELARA